MAKRPISDADAIAASNLVVALGGALTVEQLATDEDEQAALAALRRRYRRCVQIVQRVAEERQREIEGEI